MRTELGKIKSIKFGSVGYQECQAGLQLELGGKSWGVGTAVTGGWKISRSEHSKWTEEDRVKAHGEMVVKVTKLLDDAGVECVTKLVGLPVECKFEGNTLKDWRILSEVL